MILDRILRHVDPEQLAEKEPIWDWDGDLERPSLSPSVRHASVKANGYCVHFFLRGGVIEPCGDQTATVETL